MASGGGKRAFDPHTLYDVSAEEMQRIQSRRELRDRLKKEFEIKRSNPFKPVGENLVSDLGCCLQRIVMIDLLLKFRNIFSYCIIFPICIFAVENDFQQLNYWCGSVTISYS